jgi:P-type Cu+ transporter
MALQLDYKVTGMTCQNCVRHVKRAFEELDENGKPEVEIFLAEDRASVRWPASEPARSLIASSLEEAGYQIGPLAELESEPYEAPITASDLDMVPLLISVSGMTCASCVSHVEKAISHVRGTAGPSVNLTMATARVLISPETDPKTIYQAIEKAGYGAGPLTDGQAQEESGNPWRSFTIAAVPIAFMIIFQLLSKTPKHIALVQMGVSFLLLLWPGREIFLGGFTALFRLKPDMNSLVALGLFAAISFSVGTFFLSTASPVPALLFKEAGLLLLFILFGRALEQGARHSAFGALSQLLSEEPQSARKVINGELTEVRTGDLKRGDHVFIERGSRAPVDGLIIEGQSAFNESLITGESLPVSRGPGSTVLAGSINSDSPVTIEVTRAGADSTLRQLVALVSRAQAEKAPIQRFVDRVALVFVPIVLAIALLTLGLWLLLGAPLAYALSHCVAVLVVACPCALGLATPTAIVVGSAVALRQGILVKSAPVLEGLARLGLVAFDKTGTLTKGKPELVATEGALDQLQHAVSLAKQSRHPLSKAIASQETKALPGLDSVKEEPGHGITALNDRGQRVALGSEALLQNHSMVIPEFLREAISKERERGSTLVWYGCEGEARLVFALRDTAREEARAVVSELQSDGIECVVLTGDHEAAAKLVASQVGISSWKAQLRPEQKLEELDSLKRRVQPKLLAMIGDGINDAPALARADIGISLGSGTDVAREAGDIILLSPGLGALSTALKISRATLRKVRQNLLWATVYNIAGIPLAAGLFVSVGVELPPSFAGLAMALSSVSVVANSLLLNRLKTSRPLSS